MLKWVFERCDGTAKAVDTPIGRLPADGALDLEGLNAPAETMQELLSVDAEGWKAELPLIAEHFATFGDRLPQGLKDELEGLKARLG